jgi:uncharacterized protein DUF1566
VKLYRVITCLALAIISVFIGRSTFRRAHADAPTGQYTISSDGVTVLDNKTGLRWERNVSSTSTKYDWLSAIAHCSFTSIGGITGWRVPTFKELETLIDERHYGPAIDPTAFPGAPGLIPGETLFWSSTPFTKFSQRDQSFAVDFWDGSGTTVGTSTQEFVRCVR